MHLIERYALSSGSIIDQPFIYEKFFPVNSQKYLTFNAFTKSDSRNYDFWQIVIEMLYPYLMKEGVDIVQIGDPNDMPINNCIHIMGQTNVSQLAYVIRRGILHFGVDSLPTHLASYFQKKIVGIYSYSLPQQSGPYWSRPEDVVILEADKKGNKPSYNHNESPKSINRVKPEDIVNAILKLLRIDEKEQTKTVFMGSAFNKPRIDVIPNSIVAPKSYQNSLNIRGDLLFNPELIYRQLQICRSVIVTTDPLDVEKLKRLRQNLATIVYRVSNRKYDKKFIDKCKESGLQILLISDEEGEAFDKTKLLFLDYGIGREIFSTKEKLELTEEITENTVVKSNYFLLSEGKIYMSRAHWEAKKESPSFVQNEGNVLDVPHFWRDAVSYYIYNRG